MSLSADENHKSETSMMGEVAGALGDLGTFLPHVLASITVAGLNPTSVFAGFGLFYLFSGWFYRIPMAVQPMKVPQLRVSEQTESRRSGCYRYHNRSISFVSGMSSC